MKGPIRVSKLWLLIPLIAWLCGCDASQTDKSKVEEQNEDKFKDKGVKKDAQFIVDAIDACYAIMEVAQLGEEKNEDILVKGKAKRIVEGQTSVLVKLKAFAESNGISVPFSGPEKTQRSVQRLYDKNGVNFQDAWRDEIKELTEKLIADFESYIKKNENASATTVLSYALPILRSHQQLVEDKERDNLN